MQFLSFSLNGLDYGIPLEDVVTIESRKDVLMVPTAPAHIRGIVKRHGELIPVFSLTSRFGMPDGPMESLVIVKTEGMKLGLEVGKVKAIKDVGGTDVLPMPAIMGGVRNCFNDVASLQKELVVLVDVNELLTDEERELIRRLVDDAEEKEAEERRQKEEEERRKKEEAKRAREEAARKEGGQ